MIAAPTLPPPAAKPVAIGRKKILDRRRGDRSQQIRRAVQLTFLALNVWIGVEFYLFVRFYETAGKSAWAARPSGVEGWLPIASLMNLKYWVVSGSVPATHAAGMFLLIAFLIVSLLFRKAFCGWLCPVGTISEYLWKLGRETFRRNFRLPKWADYPLRALKYILLGLFLYAVGGMSAAAIRAFLEGPYGVIADVKMLNFFRYLGTTAAVTIGVLVLASIFVQNFWCRYLCPYGALMGLVAAASPVRIRRDEDLCIDCAKCAKACPSQLAVDQLIQIRSPECIACYECVSACPARGALEMTGPARRRIPAAAIAAGIALVFLGIVSYAQWSGHWRANVPSSVYYELIPKANEFGHP
jgi:polyferredoxin